MNTNIDKAVKELNKIAKINKRLPISKSLRIPQSILSTVSNRIYSVFDLVKFSSLRTMTFANALSFFSIQSIYYGINFSLISLGYNIYINYAFVEFAELLAYIFASIY